MDGAAAGPPQPPLLSAWVPSFSSFSSSFSSTTNTTTIPINSYLQPMHFSTTTTTISIKSNHYLHTLTTITIINILIMIFLSPFLFLSLIIIITCFRSSPPINTHFPYLFRLPRGGCLMTLPPPRTQHLAPSSLPRQGDARSDDKMQIVMTVSM